MNHTRRRLCLFLAGCCAGPWPAAQAASPRRKRIYMITYRGRTETDQGFFDYFAEHGHPVEFVERDIDRDIERVPALIREIRATRPDLIYCWGTPLTTALVGTMDRGDPARHVTDIPVVFTMVAAPVSAKLVPTLESSGRNLTGVYHVASTPAQVSAIRAYRSFQRLGVLYTPIENNSLLIIEELKALGARTGFAVIDRPLHMENGKPIATGMEQILREVRKAGAEWLYLPPDSFLATQARRVTSAAHALGLPTFGSAEQFMEFALAGLVSRYHSIGQFTAHKAAQILFDGLPARQIPIETLTRFSFQIRLAVAKQIKLLPPLALFDSAEFIDEVPAVGVADSKRKGG